MKHGWKWAQWHEWKALRSESPPRWKGSERRPKAGGGRSVSAAACEERESLRGDFVLLYAHVHVSTHTSTHICTHIHTSTRTQVHTHTYTHRYTHTFMPNQQLLFSWRRRQWGDISVRGSWVINVYGGTWRYFISEAGLKASQSPVTPDVESADMRLHNAVKAACTGLNPHITLTLSAGFKPSFPARLCWIRSCLVCWAQQPHKLLVWVCLTVCLWVKAADVINQK